LRAKLRFSPYAWAKLCYLRDCGPSEIGGFGLSAVDDPLLVIDVLTVRQRCSVVSVVFEDQALADLVDALVDQQIALERFTRIWIHTHPGNCPLPSSVDEETFARVFGRNDWAVMAILARGGASYARLSFHLGPGGSVPLSLAVDYRAPFAGSDVISWREEYDAHVLRQTPSAQVSELGGAGLLDPLFDDPNLWQEDLWDGTIDPRPL